jgi:hypothetical protein
MHRLILQVFLSLATAYSLWAGTITPGAACIPDTLDAYISLGSAGCMVGPFGVIDFAFSEIGVGSVAIAASDIDVTPVFPPGRYGLTFTSDEFDVTGTEFAHYLLAYTWDPGDIRGMEDVLLAFSPVAPGTATITTNACVNSPYSGATCPLGFSEVTLVVSHDGITPDLFDSVGFAPLTTFILGIRHTIELDANGASSQIDGFTNQLVVPEPALTWMIGCAALLFAALGRRRRPSLKRR